MQYPQGSGGNDMTHDKVGSSDSREIIEKRQAENESVFRKANEKVINGLEEFNTLAHHEGVADLAENGDVVLHFICECSDENCKERIPLAISEYARLHEDRRNFIVVPGHQVTEIEKTVSQRTRFALVKKFMRPREKDVSLKATPTNNA